MAISLSTRKKLWAKSGNQCAICKCGLVLEDKISGTSFVLGEECHIISSKVNGPRAADRDVNFYDCLENLILLCPSHHAEVDKNESAYSVERLLEIKQKHEHSVAINLGPQHQTSKKTPTLLLRVTSGKELLDLIRGVYASQLDHDEVNSEEEAELVGGFLQELHDWVDVLPDIGMGEIAKIGYQLGETINALDAKGFWVFGQRRDAKMLNGLKEDVGVWPIATVTVVRKDNPAIAKLASNT